MSQHGGALILGRVVGQSFLSILTLTLGWVLILSVLERAGGAALSGAPRGEIFYGVMSNKSRALVRILLRPHGMPRVARGVDLAK